jgi:hypothetical protein
MAVDLFCFGLSWLCPHSTLSLSGDQPRPESLSHDFLADLTRDVDSVSLTG